MVQIGNSSNAIWGAFMSKLSTNSLHWSAAASYRRAANCLRNAKRFPWTSERELRSAAYWVGSAAYWRQQVQFDRVISTISAAE
jgi:hypothetical protein